LLNSSNTAAKCIYLHNGQTYRCWVRNIFNLAFCWSLRCFDCSYPIQEIIIDYFNDSELNGKYLGTITKNFVVVCDTLLEASSQIRKSDFR